ncbi:hypothetical protein T459_26095 [Capsicum annuum]|uniref:F-box domain-containing protein n=1 Tax=Capsicum annuum TaxID=4072 RepID=A0A2G2YN23_CAPAN|nr:hypothetical protein T459_26095 [Capsicum annuum]
MTFVVTYHSCDALPRRSSGLDRNHLLSDDIHGKCIMGHMDVDEATCHFNCPFQDDIIMEILYRLPVRDLFQFKCVSKLWNALISDPHFVNKHLYRAKNDPHSQKLLIYQRSLTDPTTSIYSCPLSSSLQQLLIKTPDISYGTPSTRESILLPQPIFPVQTGYSLGLGYDSTSGDYKILNICSHSHGSKVPGEILSLKSGSWRTIDNHPRGIENLLHCSGSALALVNDAFHWVCISGNYFEDSRAFSLVSFSISKEVYADIPLPEQLLRLEGNIGIGVSELDGMLCAHSICEHLRKRTFKLWVLKDYGVNESWIALLVIDAWDILRSVPKYRFADGEVLFSSTNLLGKPTHSFWTSRESFGMCDAIRGGFAFTESLISPKSLI